MRIACPYCGERSNAEFSYLGDAAPVRPAGGSGARVEFVDYVYIRRNPPGLLREWWQHSGGCRAWLAVERDVSTHGIVAVTAAAGGQTPAAMRGRTPTPPEASR